MNYIFILAPQVKTPKIMLHVLDPHLKSRLKAMDVGIGGGVEYMHPHVSHICLYTFFYKNKVYKNIEAQNC